MFSISLRDEPINHWVTLVYFSVEQLEQCIADINKGEHRIPKSFEKIYKGEEVYVYVYHSKEYYKIIYQDATG